MTFSDCWSCCNCGSGFLTALYTGCFNCDHRKCHQCSKDESLPRPRSVQNRHSIPDNQRSALVGVHTGNAFQLDPFDDLSESSGDETTTPATVSSHGPDYYSFQIQVAEAVNYHGPLLALKSDALLLLLGAYQQTRAPNSENQTNNKSSTGYSGKSKSSKNSPNEKAETSRSKFTKRKERDQDDDENEEEERQGGKRRCQDDTDSKILEDEKLLACPFAKVDFWKYRKCNKFELRDINRLKYVQPTFITLIYC
jgi:hypothetical protein